MQLILFLFLLYFVILFIFKKIRQNFSSFFQKNSPQEQPNDFQPSHSSHIQVIDEMKRCEYCGTYSPRLQAYVKKNLYFCNAECHEAFIARQKN